MTGSRVLVVQQGSRHNYAMPAAFARRDLLEAFYTDLCAGRGIGRLAGVLSGLPGSPGAVRRLASRRPPPAVLEKTRTFDRWGLALERALKITDGLVRVREIDRVHRMGGDMMAKAGWGRATHILTNFAEGHNLLRQARNAGVKIVIDVNVAVSAERIFVEEQARYPGWQDKDLFWGQTVAATDPSFDPLDTMFSCAHRFLCPSSFVRDDLVENFGVDPKKTLIVPYSIHPSWLQITPKPIPKRILFAGAADLRKGIHILAEAAAIIKATDPAFQIRVVGSVSDRVRARPEVHGLDFVGRVPREAMKAEFANADVFVLPSLAEGSAGVIYEALAAGVPVVTTFETGSVVQDGEHGYIVPARNATALAEAVIDICNNRTLRNRMSNAARQIAQDFTWDRYAGRLVEAVITS